MQPARFRLYAKERTGSRLPHSCTTSSGMTARSLICSGSRCTTSSGITARSSICSGSTCAERFHGHGGATMAAMAASWQQQPAQRARAGGGRNAGARHHARQRHHAQPLTWSLLSSPVMVCTAGLSCSVGRSVDERARRRSVGLGGVGPQRLIPTLF